MTKKYLNLKEELEKTSQVREAYVPELDSYIRFCLLSHKEIERVARTVKDPYDVFLKIVAQALRKADPQATEDKIRMLPPSTFIAIGKAILLHPGFLPEDLRQTVRKILEQDQGSRVPGAL